MTAAGWQPRRVMSHVVDFAMAALVSLILAGLIVLVAELAP
jgi:hypothetical protein